MSPYEIARLQLAIAFGAVLLLLYAGSMWLILYRGKQFRADLLDESRLAFTRLSMKHDGE